MTKGFLPGPNRALIAVVAALCAAEPACARPIAGRNEGDGHLHGGVARYVAEFNAADEELYTNTVPNAAAAEFLAANIPVLECPDPDIERAYYFRWWTFRKHLKKTELGWVITEFLPEVAWAGPENTIVCPFGHHVREGRWLRDGTILRDYMRFMVESGTIDGTRSYVNWPAFAYLERARVWGENGDALSFLPRLAARYAAWEKGWKFRDGYPMRFDAKDGLFHSADNREGMEYSASGHGARLMVNAAMAAEAAAIAALARAKGDRALAGEYAAKADALEKNIKAKLWSDELAFFVTRHDDGTLADVREIQGYAPWYFAPAVGKKYASAWPPLVSPAHFLGKFGLRTVDRSSPRYTISYSGHPCQWNGPSWPYTTSLALTALGNAIRSGESGGLGAADYVRLVRQYAAAHRLAKGDGGHVDWIDENLDPETGDWISRTMLQRLPAQARTNPRERGKDYNHSTFCDLVISDIAGFQPDLDGRFAVKPLIPPDWPYFRLENMPWRGHLVSIFWDRDGTRYGKGSGLRVLVDGKAVPADAVWSDCAETLRADVIGRSKLVEAKDANGAWNWTDGARFPDAGTDYVIRHFTRTPQTAEGCVFGGKSLKLVPGGALNLKPLAGVTYVFPRDGLVLAGGLVAHLAHGARVALAGRITVTSPANDPVVFRPAPDESVRTAFATAFALDASLAVAPGCALRVTADRSRNDPQFSNWGIVELNGDCSAYRGILDVREHGVAIFNNPAPFPGVLSVGTNGYIGVTNLVSRTFPLSDWVGGGFWIGFDPDAGKSACIALPAFRRAGQNPLHLVLLGVKAVRPACVGRTYGPLLKVPAASGLTADDVTLEVRGYDAFVPLPRFRIVARDEADGMRAFYAEACALTDEERKMLPLHVWMDEPPDQTWTVKGQYPEVPGARRAVIFEGNEANGAYNHHAKIAFAHGRFHASWSNQRYDEDGPGQRVLYASSEDGIRWGDPRELVPALSPETPWGGPGVFCQAGDFFEQDGRLFAMAAVTEIIGWQNRDKTKSSPVHTRECGWPIYASRGRVVREIRKDGTFGPLLSRFKGVRTEVLIRPVQPLEKVEPGIKFPSLGWNDMDALRQMPERRLCESIAWKRPGGGFVGLFRDDSGSGYKWMSFSDNGYKWAKPHITDMHDAQSLSRALELDDGTILLVGNHRGLGRSVPGLGWCDRDPLLISVSRDGVHFSGTHTVIEGFYRFKVWPGPRARGGSAQYPHLIVHGGMCHVIYSLGKESIGTTCFPLANLLENAKIPVAQEKEQPR